MLPITVTIPGPVVGKGRPRFVRATGRVYTPGPTVSAENRIAHELAIAWRKPPVDEALVLTIEVRVAVPASKSKKFRDLALASGVFPVGKPDLDNIVKLIGDSGNGIVWTDDSRITRIAVSRRYANDPGLTISVAAA